MWRKLRDDTLDEVRVEALAERRGVEARAFTLTLGLVDAHTPLLRGVTRSDYADRLNGVSYEEIAARGGGIRDTMRHTRAASVEALATQNLRRLDEHLRRGVTTVEVKSGYGLSANEEFKQLRVIREMSRGRSQRVIPTCLAAHVPPPEFNRPETYLEAIEETLLPKLLAEGLTRRVDAFIEPSAFPVDIARPYLQRAQELGFELTIHADQFSEEARVSQPSLAR